jgi:hypothetical protein
MNTHVEGISVEVVEALNQLRIVIDSPEHGMEADLLFTGRAPAQEEPRFTRRSGAQIFMDYTRLTQNGSWVGWIKHQGTLINVTPENWLGTRDRSWGIRPVGMADAQANPQGLPMNQFYWLWAPINWPDAVSLYHLNDDADGFPWNTDGLFIPLGVGAQAETMRKVSSDLTFIPGTRHAAKALISFQRRGGGEVNITMSPRFHWYMKGVGYGHPTFPHGLYHGGPASVYEEYVLSEIDDAMTLHIQAISTVTMRGDLGEREGHGVLEQLIVGPHQPSGFKELLDMAP